MCLDIKQIHNNQVNMEKVETNSRVIGKLESVSDFPIKCLCGGSLVDFQVVFDPNRE